MQLLVGLWLLGCVVRLCFELFFILQFRRSLSRSCTALRDPFFLEQISKAASTLGLKKSPDVYSCTLIPGPMLVGFWRPVLLLPDAAHYASEDLDCMLRHELIHYRCHHMLYKLMLLVLCCLQWWNPAAYLLRRQADQDLELACDRWALSGKPPPTASGMAAPC